jgi:hypothetical protein
MPSAVVQFAVMQCIQHLLLQVTCILVSSDVMMLNNIGDAAIHGSMLAESDTVTRSHPVQGVNMSVTGHPA